MFRGTLRPLLSPERARGYLCASKVLLKDFSAYVQAVTGRLKDAVIATAHAAGRPYQFLRSARTDKLALAREIAARHQVRDGLIAVFSALEPGLAVSVRGGRCKDRRE